MDFTKDQICQELTDEFKTSNDKDIDVTRTVKEIVDNAFQMVGAESEIKKEDFKRTVKSMVQSAIGMSRKVASDATKPLQEKVSGLEAENKKLQDSKSKPKNDDEPNDDKYAKLEERLNAIEKERTENETKAKIVSKKKEISAKAKELGVNDDTFLSKICDKLSVNADADVDTEAKSILELYNVVRAGSGDDDQPVGTPSHHDATESTIQNLEKIVESNKI